LTGSLWADAPIDLRVEVRPPWPFRLGGGSADGLARRRGSALQRLLHAGEEPVLVGVVQPAPDRVVFAARARCEAAAAHGIERMRFATGVDDDLRPFHEAFRGDPYIGAAVRSRPQLRVRRRPEPWEALAAAITEQLIELERALVIQRRLIGRLGRRCPRTGLRDAPTPAAVAAVAPAELEALDLAHRRALALRRAAREVSSGRVDLHDHEGAWRRLHAIPDIGAWTLEMLALEGQGRYDCVPAGDLGFLKLIGRLSTGNPRARADEAEVRGFFARYGRWQGLAGQYLMYAGGRGLIRPGLPDRDLAPRRAGTRWSAPAARPAAA
jgi:DNA-3-methyladenine glycosylase II